MTVLLQAGLGLKTSEDLFPLVFFGSYDKQKATYTQPEHFGYGLYLQISTSFPCICFLEIVNTWQTVLLPLFLTHHVS